MFFEEIYKSMINLIDACSEIWEKNGIWDMIENQSV